MEYYIFYCIQSNLVGYQLAKFVIINVNYQLYIKIG